MLCQAIWLTTKSTCVYSHSLFGSHIVLCVLICVFVSAKVSSEEWRWEEKSHQTGRMKGKLQRALCERAISCSSEGGT